MQELRVVLPIAAIAAALVACDQRSTIPARQQGGYVNAPVAGSAAAAQASTPSQHVRFEGDFGDVFWGDSSAVVVKFGQLHVSRGDSSEGPRGTMTFLYYSISECNRLTWVCSSVYGGGFIPNEDLSGSGRQLHLATNTAANADFFTSGPRGSIVVDWTVNGVSETRWTGTFESSYPGIRTHQRGSNTSRSADASGAVVGVAIPPAAMASIGTNRGVYMTIYR